RRQRGDRRVVARVRRQRRRFMGHRPRDAARRRERDAARDAPRPTRQPDTIAFIWRVCSSSDAAAAAACSTSAAFCCVTASIWPTGIEQVNRAVG
ncbi:hypothetical protein KPA99_35300, partial [Burkholderia cenocepacia]|nr:hypothetical protein [Burkholderia cenocepacia]